MGHNPKSTYDQTLELDSRLDQVLGSRSCIVVGSRGYLGSGLGGRVKSRGRVEHWDRGQDLSQVGLRSRGWVSRSGVTIEFWGRDDRGWDLGLGLEFRVGVKVRSNDRSRVRIGPRGCGLYCMWSNLESLLG
ncbi:hypothetical protein HAX54_005440 [Datura stramonium]|uniref:Uncharacterized protein n=1 Tax=Datura stramonium TaxID=4076 RepID=A0ABS8TB62_DATST|nr:hypothetical protein [Datura stramonium]